MRNFKRVPAALFLQAFSAVISSLSLVTPRSRNSSPRSMAAPAGREMSADLVNPAIIYVMKDTEATVKA